MSQLLERRRQTLTPYVPGEQPKLPNLVKLNTNENPYAPSPQRAATRDPRADRRQPAPLSRSAAPSAARKRVAATFGGIKPPQVFVGNGSDEVLAHAFLALLKHERPILFPDITYSFYPVYCGLYGVAYETVPLDDDFADPRRRLRAARTAASSSPTRTRRPAACCRWPKSSACVAANPDSVVVIDEAYVDFGGRVSAIPLIDRYPNLLVVQTLSKSRSLAGLRVGFAVGHAQLIEALERVKNSFNSYPLDRLAIAGAAPRMKTRSTSSRPAQAVIAQPRAG